MLRSPTSVHAHVHTGGTRSTWALRPRFPGHSIRLRPLVAEGDAAMSALAEMGGALGFSDGVPSRLRRLPPSATL